MLLFDKEGSCPSHFFPGFLPSPRGQGREKTVFACIPALKDRGKCGTSCSLSPNICFPHLYSKKKNKPSFSASGPDYGLHFSASFTVIYGHVTGFLPMDCESGCCERHPVAGALKGKGCALPFPFSRHSPVLLAGLWTR